MLKALTSLVVIITIALITASKHRRLHQTLPSHVCFILIENLAHTTVGRVVVGGGRTPLASTTFSEKIKRATSSVLAIKVQHLIAFISFVTVTIKVIELIGL